MTEELDIKSLSLPAASKKLLDGALKEDDPTKFLSSGVLGLDLVMSGGKGIPIGSSTILWAEPGLGKSTLVADLCRHLIKNHRLDGEPFKVLYLDIEYSKDLLRKVITDECWTDVNYVSQLLTWRVVEEFFKAVLIKYKGYEDVKVIVVDSISNILSDQQSSAEKSVADGDYGTRNKERNTFMSKYMPLCHEHGITTFFISQVRVNQDAGLYGAKAKAAVSYGDLHNVDIVMKCSKKANKTDAEKVVTKTIDGERKEQKGYIVDLSCNAERCKNRFYSGPGTSVKLVKGAGIDNVYTLRNLLEANDYIKATGGYYTISKDLIELIPDLPDKKLRRKEINKLLRPYVKDLTQILKERDQFKIVIEETEEDSDDE